MKSRQDPERMKVLLARRERRGWSWAELSRRSSLPVWKLRGWQRRLARADSSRPSTPTFVPIQIPPSRSLQESFLEVITPSGFRIRVSTGFAPDELNRLVRTLETSC